MIAEYAWGAMWNLISMTVGALIAWHFAMSGAKSLEEEAEKLRAESATLKKLVNNLAQALNSCGAIQASFDSEGDLIRWSSRVNLMGAEIRTNSQPPEAG